ncbi:MAG: hypothetical protein IOC92_15910 [Rhodobacter sp.]|nr:hypothetical protein [Rhodobacter sp.]MCA3460074.1 hypothetical protein [Rhodobacter sp.]MCA3465475.1 hypothetical protein [Rhodobacter sp.]MCA3468390.1 hypothetical protein [Rhodobacter sp.]MCA3469733.1 hypothetical protein [Rhodobacter sp.]
MTPGNLTFDPTGQVFVATDGAPSSARRRGVILCIRPSLLHKSAEGIHLVNPVW